MSTPLHRYPGETLKQYRQCTGLETWATREQQRAQTQEYIRNYCRANNPPHVVARLEREWAALDKGCVRQTGGW